MITASTVTDFKAINALTEFYEAYPVLVANAVKDEFEQRIKPPFLRELQFVPNQLPDLPFIWSADPAKQKRARAYYFAVKVPKGSKGGRYKRTNTLVKFWDVDVVISDNAVAITAKNPKREIQYVSGRRQVPGHKKTWVRHALTIAFWADASREVIPAALKKVAGLR